MLDRFPEITENQRTGLIRKGITLQDAYRVDSMWSKIQTTTKLSNPAAYLYRMLESALPARQEATSGR